MNRPALQQPALKKVFYGVFNSRIGEVTVTTDGIQITELHIQGDRYFSGPLEHWVKDPTHPLLFQARQQLLQYFDGKLRLFELPLQASGTQFQQSVWNALRLISYGSTISYRELAERIGKPKAMRAVGTAVGKNPICIVVPCHRVLASGGALGGYVAGLKVKRKLLALEASI